MKRFATLFVFTLALTFAGAAAAVPLTFVTELSGDQEVPPVTTPGTGTATVIIDDEAHTLSVDVVFSDLLGPTAAAHIHCCQPLGTNAGVATTTPSFPGFPTGVMAGTFSATFDTLDLGSYNPSFVTANGGTAASAEAALFAGIEAGLAYFNLHTSPPLGTPSGEIRGQLELLQVPEPATLALMFAGMLAALSMRRRGA
jgi:hypothetical protein